MNERILELMAKAGFDVEKLRTHPGGWPREDLLILQDFAKLIINDCVRVVLDTYGTGACDMDPHIAVLEACRNIESEFDVDMGHLTDYVDGEDE